MDFNEYQKKARTTALYMKGIDEKFPNLDKEIYSLLAISYVIHGLGEVGEIQNKFKKVIRDNGCIVTESFIKDIEKEIGDVLWYCANLCEELGLEFNKVADKNIEKLFSRKDRGVIQGSGDSR